MKTLQNKTKQSSIRLQAGYLPASTTEHYSFLSPFLIFHFRCGHLDQLGGFRDEIKSSQIQRFQALSRSPRAGFITNLKPALGERLSGVSGLAGSFLLLMVAGFVANFLQVVVLE